MISGDLKEKVKALIGDSSVSEVDKITGKVVKVAALDMKPDKGDVTGGFSSNAILNAPDIMFDHMAAIFPKFSLPWYPDTFSSCMFIFATPKVKPERSRGYRILQSNCWV